MADTMRTAAGWHTSYGRAERRGGARRRPYGGCRVRHGQERQPPRQGKAGTQRAGGNCRRGDRM